MLRILPTGTPEMASTSLPPQISLMGCLALTKSVVVEMMMKRAKVKMEMKRKTRRTMVTSLTSKATHIVRALHPP
jgi:hypothetical protein